MRRLTRGSLREAQNIITLTQARTSGSGGAGASSVPQPTAQNEMLIANATPAWSLLDAPVAEGQVLITGADPYTPAWTALTVSAISDLAYAAPALTLSTSNVEGSADTIIRSDATILVFDVTAPNTIQPDDTAAAGSATVAARRDHEHAIICAAPASPSVSLAASAEGSGTSFARDDHAHQLDQTIAPTWTSGHDFTGGASFVRAAAATTSFSVYVTGDSFSRLYVPAGGELYFGSGAAGADVKLYRSAANTLRLEDLFVVDAGITLNGATGTNIITVPDNVAQAAHLVDAGGIEYLRIVSTDAQPVVVFNEGGADVDHRWEASGQANALFVQGSDAAVGMGTGTPADTLHLYSTANAPHGIIIDAQGTQNIQHATLEFITLGDGSKPLADAATLGWQFTARGNAWAADAAQQNNLRLAYWDGSAYTSSQQWHHDGGSYVWENSAWARVSGTFALHFVIPEPIVETVGQIRIPWDCTVTRVDGNVQGGTSCTVNVEEVATLGSAGTDILSSDMAADANGESVTSSFGNSSLAEGNHLAFDVSAVSGAVDFVSITITGTID